MIAHATLETINILLTWGDLKDLAENGSVALIYFAAIFKQINFVFMKSALNLR
jgi:hypothetical protein